MKRLLLGSLAAAAILMVWGFLYWGVNPLAKSVLKSIDGEETVLQALDGAIDEDGVYFMPMEGMEERSQSYVERHTRGPIARISFKKTGANPMSPMIFVMGFFHYFLSAFVMGMILTKAAPVLLTKRKRWDFVVLVALFAVLFIDWTDAIWMYGPSSWAWFQTGYHVIGWMLAGSALVAIMKPEAD